MAGDMRLYLIIPWLKVSGPAPPHDGFLGFNFYLSLRVMAKDSTSCFSNSKVAVLMLALLVLQEPSARWRGMAGRLALLPQSGLSMYLLCGLQQVTQLIYACISSYLK